MGFDLGRVRGCSGIGDPPVWHEEIEVQPECLLTGLVNGQPIVGQGGECDRREKEASSICSALIKNR